MKPKKLFVEELQQYVGGIGSSNPNLTHVVCVTTPCDPIFVPGSAANSVRQDQPTLTTLACGEEGNYC